MIEVLIIQYIVINNRITEYSCLVVEQETPWNPFKTRCHDPEISGRTRQWQIVCKNDFFFFFSVT